MIELTSVSASRSTGPKSRPFRSNRSPEYKPGVRSEAMKAEFFICVDVGRSLVSITLSGFFVAADVERFLEARNAAHRQLICEPNAHLTLADVQNMKIQSQGSVEAFGSLLSDPAQQSRKLALVFGLSLARMQLLRVTEDRRARYFGNVAEAEDWLFADDELADNGR